MSLRTETLYAEVGGSDVAYQVFGREEPAPVLVLVTGVLTNVETRWGHPLVEYLLGRLGSFSRVVVFDPRGTGMSGPVKPDDGPYWERWTEELEAVLDAAGCQRASIFANNEAGPAAIYCAAAHPQRVSSLFLVNTGARYLIDDDYPYGVSRWAAESLLSIIGEMWGTEAFAALVTPSLADDREFLSWLAKFLSSSASPEAAASVMRQLVDGDMRQLLPTIKVPTVVINRTAHPFAPPDMGRYLADHITGARFIELPGSDTSFYARGSERIFDIIEEILDIPINPSPD